MSKLIDRLQQKKLNMNQKMLLLKLIVTNNQKFEQIKT